jgi:hypothetical protein
MRNFTPMLTGVSMMLAFSLVGPGAASAAETLWELLPGVQGTSITDKSGKVTMQIKGGFSTICEKSKSTGEVGEGKTLGGETITLEGCTTAGLTSLTEGGKEKGVITIPVFLHTCVIKSGDAGIKFTLAEEIHVFVPAIKASLVVKGTFIALIAPTKSLKTGPFSLGVEQKEGKQSIEKCEGGIAQTLETSTNGGVFVQTGIQFSEATLTFGVAQEIMV